ncbi:hypothetical protein CTAYLR_003561 [Chrysophaeum taylorii]|uniref:DNA-3-methyladenine glycosylase I n=1 Tax=Chrysophaeum taylorii TaxID=2483200 RepID=A0AAD7XT40_9STRA|nr:hypothetical protein CTAYLR_003561 [Chrysophaeum taylorii]
MTSAEPWFVGAFGGKMSQEYRRYMSEEWGVEKRGDQPLFEKLCLEGAQAGLSWATILAKRENYRAAFHDFDIDRCAEMTSADVDALVDGDGGVIRHRGKLESVAHNARCVLAMRDEHKDEVPPEHGWFDEFLWSFVDGTPRLNDFESFQQMPCETPASIAMSKALKARGFKFVGPKICYSLMQACGLVIDHPRGTPEWLRAKKKLQATEPAGRDEAPEPRATTPPPTKRPRRASRRH